MILTGFYKAVIGSGSVSLKRTLKSKIKRMRIRITALDFSFSFWSTFYHLSPIRSILFNFVLDFKVTLDKLARASFIFISILFGFFVWWQLQMSALFNHYVANLWGSPISFRRYHYGWDALSFWLYRENRTEEKGEKKKHLKKSQSDHNFYGLFSRENTIPTRKVSFSYWS